MKRQLTRRYLWMLCAKVAQSCLTLCHSMDCTILYYPVHGILQAGILEWVAFPFSRGCSQPRDWTQVSRIAGESPVFWRIPRTVWSTRSQQVGHDLATLTIIISQNLFKILFTELMMLSNHLILCHTLLLFPSIFPSIRISYHESALKMDVRMKC